MLILARKVTSAAVSVNIAGYGGDLAASEIVS